MPSCAFITSKAVGMTYMFRKADSDERKWSREASAFDSTTVLRISARNSAGDGSVEFSAASSCFKNE
jgi:hypothetical protein